MSKINLLYYAHANMYCNEIPSKYIMSSIEETGQFKLLVGNLISYAFQ